MYRPLQAPTKEEITARHAVLHKFLTDEWTLLSHGAKLPTEEDSVKNFQAFGRALQEFTVIGKGTKPVRADVLADIVAWLVKENALEYPPQVVEKIVEVEKKVPLTRKEALKAAADLTRQMNDPNRHPVKGRGEEHEELIKPHASREQLEAQATHDLRENEIAGDIAAAIRQHRGKTHGDTDAQRRILQRIFDEGVNANTPNAEILKQIENKRNEMIRWDAQQAIRIVYAPQFRERGIDLSQRTPSKFGENQ